MNTDLFAKEYVLDSLTTIIPRGHKFSMFVPPRFVRQFSGTAYEQFSSRLVANFVNKCDLFLDVGAHYGFYSLVANESNKQIKTIAIEPVEENYEILKRNLRANGIWGASAHLLRSALGDRIGEVDFFKSSASDNGGLFEHPNATVINKFKVSITTIDHILREEESRSLFIKMATECNEMDVIKGMDNTFKKYRELYLLIKMNPKMLKLAGTSCEEIFEYLSLKGFKVFGIDDRKNKYYPLDTDENLIRMQETSGYFNVLCIRKDVALSVAFFSHSAGLAGAERSLVDLVQTGGTRRLMLHCFASQRSTRKYPP